MRLDFYTTTIQANVVKERDHLESAYDRYPDATRFWCFIDLVSSSNYRICRGPKEGYIRSETFFSLIRNVITPCDDIHYINEIGDAVLLSSASFRPMFECLVLIDQVARQMASLFGDERYPFAIRGAIGFGTAKRLVRLNEAFVGTSIDLLSRIMSVRSDAINLYLHEDAYRSSREIVGEYSDFISLSEPKMLSQDVSKGILVDVCYREINVDSEELLRFQEFFIPWRDAAMKR